MVRTTYSYPHAIWLYIVTISVRFELTASARVRPSAPPGSVVPAVRKPESPKARNPEIPKSSPDKTHSVLFDYNPNDQLNGTRVNQALADEICFRLVQRNCHIVHFSFTVGGEMRIRRRGGSYLLDLIHILARGTRQKALASRFPSRISWSRWVGVGGAVAPRSCANKMTHRPIRKTVPIPRHSTNFRQTVTI